MVASTPVIPITPASVSTVCSKSAQHDSPEYRTERVIDSSSDGCSSCSSGADRSSDKKHTVIDEYFSNMWIDYKGLNGKHCTTAT